MKKQKRMLLLTIFIAVISLVLIFPRIVRADSDAYKVLVVVGTSIDSWEDAVQNAIETEGDVSGDLIAVEVEKLDMVVDDGKVAAYRARVNLSFKYNKGPE